MMPRSNLRFDDDASSRVMNRLLSYAPQRWLQRSTLADVLRLAKVSRLVSSRRRSVNRESARASVVDPL